MDINLTGRHKGALFAGITALTWGFQVIAIKVAVNEVDPVSLVWVRFLEAFTVLFFFYLIQKPRALRILVKPPLLLVLTALCLAFNYIGFALGIKLTTPGNAQIFIQLGPLLLAISGFVFFKETLNRNKLIGFGLAGIGYLLFYNDQLHNILVPEVDYLKGVFWVILAAIGWAVFSVLQKILVKKYSPQTLNMFVYALATLIYLPFVDWHIWASLSGVSWGLIVFLGFSTLVAYGCLAAALKYTEASTVSIIVTLNPVITFFLMAMFSLAQVSWIVPENIQWMGVLGAVLVLCGAALVVKSRSR